MNKRNFIKGMNFVSPESDLIKGRLATHLLVKVIYSIHYWGYDLKTSLCDLLSVQQREPLSFL